MSESESQVTSDIANPVLKADDWSFIPTSVFGHCPDFQKYLPSRIFTEVRSKYTQVLISGIIQGPNYQKYNYISLLKNPTTSLYCFFSYVT